MTNFKDVAKRIYGIISGHGHDLKMFTDGGQETTKLKKARRFFVSEPNYMVTVDEQTREIVINRNEHTELDDFDKLMKKISQLGTRHIIKVSFQEFGKQIQPKDYAMQARQSDEVLESTMYGSRKTSYQKLEDVKIIVKHKHEVDKDQTGSRSRGIKSIYLEVAGERTQFPYPLLTAARAMGRHMSKGGKMADRVGSYIMELTETLVNLREFANYARRMPHNDQSQQITKLAREQYESARRSLKKFSGSRTYQAMCDEAATLSTVDDSSLTDGEDVKELFTVKHVDSRVEAALPHIQKLLAQQKQKQMRLESASKQPFYLNNAVVTEDDIIEYSDPQKNMGRKLRSMINRVSEKNELSEYLSMIAEDLLNGSTLTEFDKKIIKNILENVVITVD